MKNIVYVFILPFVMLFSCVEEVDPSNLLNATEKVFIQGYLSPQSEYVSVTVSKALPNIGTPLRSNNPEAVKDKFTIKTAIVTIENPEGDIIELPYSSESFVYQISKDELAIKVGETYKLMVQNNGENYTASCIIPKSINDFTYTLDNRVDGEGYNYSILDISFQDIVGASSFYIVGATERSSYEGEEYTYPLYFDYDRFVNDAIGDGELLNASAELWGFSFEEGNVGSSFTIQVAQVEEVLYQDLRASFVNDYEEGNPFVEYAVSPNNIEGENVIGVFAGYNLTEKIIEFNGN